MARTKLTLDERIDRLVDRSAGPDKCHYFRGRVCQSNGYAYINIDGKARLLHRVVYELEHGVKLRRDQPVLHSAKCHTRRCVNPKHLRQGTLKENMADAVAAGAMGKVKLNLAKASEIRLMFGKGKGTGPSLNEVAVCFGVTPQTVQHVIAGRTWAKGN